MQVNEMGRAAVVLFFTTYSNSNELVMKNDPREKVHQCYGARKKRHDNGYIKSAKSIYQEVVCQHPH